MPTHKTQSEHKTQALHPTTSANISNIHYGASDRHTILLSKMNRVAILTPLVVGVAALFTFKRRWIVNFAMKSKT
jgi:hypothetical protein